MQRITEAVILMAGAGSRLATARGVLPKPLVPILGRPLISYVIDALQSAGVETIHGVVGADSTTLLQGVRALMPSSVRFSAIENLDWQKQNGISFLAARGAISAPFFLTMGDHLFDPRMLRELAVKGDRQQLNLAVDSKLDQIFDLDDAMKVQTRDQRVVAIGKDLAQYDAIDTGVFLCPLETFDFVERAKQHGDCSLADGVRLMAQQGRVAAIDVGDAWWQDVDTAEMLQRAQSELRRLTTAAGCERFHVQA